MPPTFNPFNQLPSLPDSERLEDIEIFIEGLPDPHQDSTPVFAIPFSSPKVPDTVNRDSSLTQHSPHDNTGPENDAQSVQLLQVSSTLVDVMASPSAMNDIKNSEVKKAFEVSSAFFLMMFVYQLQQAPAVTLEESTHDAAPISRAAIGNLIDGFDATGEDKSTPVAPVEEAVQGETQKEDVVPRDRPTHQEESTVEATPVSRPTTGNFIGNFNTTGEEKPTPVPESSPVAPLEQATAGNLIGNFNTTGGEKPTPGPESSPIAALEKAVQEEAQKEEVAPGGGSTPEAMTGKDYPLLPIRFVHYFAQSLLYIACGSWSLDGDSKVNCVVLTPQQDSYVRVTNPGISNEENKPMSGLYLSKVSRWFSYFQLRPRD